MRIDSLDDERWGSAIEALREHEGGSLVRILVGSQLWVSRYTTVGPGRDDRVHVDILKYGARDEDVQDGFDLLRSITDRYRGFREVLDSFGVVVDYVDGDEKGAVLVEHLQEVSPGAIDSQKLW